MSILITGTTGFVGSAFLARFLDSDELRGRKVFAVVRPGKTSSNDRVMKSLAKATHAINKTDKTPEDLVQQVTVLDGDVTQSLYGLDAKSLQVLAANHVTEIWHIASDLSPNGYDANVASANATAGLATHLDVENIKYISTAYVTGKGSASYNVDDDVGGKIEFNNAYEQSKFDAEQILSKAAKQNDWRLTILRPTIIVGHRDSKLPAGTTGGLYGVVRLLAQHRNRPAQNGAANQISLLCGDGTLNLVYIDRVVDQMLAAATNQPLVPGIRSRFIGGTNVPVNTILKSLQSCLGTKISRVSYPKEISKADRILNKKLAFFSSYTQIDNQKTITGETLSTQDEIYDVDVLNLIEAACNECRHGSLMDDMRMLRLQRATGGPLVAYVNRVFDPNAETVVLVNAYGMTNVTLHPLISQFAAKGFNTVTWDCRGLPDRGFDLADVTDVTMDDHFDDWELLCAVLKLRKMHLVGWSTGAVVASYIAAKAPKSINRLALVNGSFMHPKAELTPFQKNLKSIMPKVAVSQSIAKVLFNSVFREDRSSVVRLFTREIANKAEAAMSVTLPHEKHLVQTLTANPDQVFRYARLIRSFVKVDPMTWLTGIRLPTAIFTGSGDITAHPRGSYDAASAIPSSSMHMAQNATHLSLYSDPEFIAAITGFVADDVNWTQSQRKVA